MQFLLFLLFIPFAEAKCLQDWSEYNGKCFRQIYDFSVGFTYEKAEQKCKSFGGYLAQPENAEELNFVHKISIVPGLPEGSRQRILLGIVKDSNNKRWHYAREEDKKKTAYLPWCKGAPNNWKGRDNCLVIKFHSKSRPCYLDGWCDGVYPGLRPGWTRIICQMPTVVCKDPNAEVVNGQCVCKKDFIDITATDVPERRKYKPGEKCVPVHPCKHINDSFTVMFIVDSSESIKLENWKSLVEFLRMGADQLPSSARVGFIKYSENVTFANFLKVGWTKDEFHKFVPTKYDNGTTNTPDALDKARKLLTQKDHSRKQVAVLITDGLPFMAKTGGDKNAALKLTKKAADKLHAANIPLVALGYGPSLKNEEKNIREWLQDEEDYFAYDKLACDLKNSHMSILMQKVCRRFL